MEEVTRKRPVNLSVSAEILQAARQARVNCSALLERALLAEVAHARRLKWREENATAVEAHNDYLMLHGACFEGRFAD